MLLIHGLHLQSGILITEYGPYDSQTRCDIAGIRGRVTGSLFSSRLTLVLGKFVVHTQ